MLGQLIDADWGNPRLRHFTTTARTWETCCVVNLADGYFRHAMFMHPKANLWAWALEWNGRLRVFGLFGEAAAQEAFVAGLPEVRADFGHGDTTNGFVMRVDTPLGEDDLLFATPDGFEELPFARPHWRDPPSVDERR